MGSKLSVSQVVSKLEARLDFHRQQEAFHAQQEAHHREQRTVHAAEMEKVQARLEPFPGKAYYEALYARGPKPKE